MFTIIDILPHIHPKDVFDLKNNSRLSLIEIFLK